MWYEADTWKVNGDKNLELVSGFCNFWCHLNWFISANPLQKRANPWRQNIFAYFHTSALSGSQYKLYPTLVKIYIEKQQMLKRRKQIIRRIELGGNPKKRLAAFQPLTSKTRALPQFLSPWDKFLLCIYFVFLQELFVLCICISSLSPLKRKPSFNSCHCEKSL